MSASVRFGDTWASVLLDLLRAVAALIVLAEHWRNFFFVDFREISMSHRWMFAPAYVLTAGGHLAVIIFFLLSGFLISGSVLRMLNRKAWTWRRYATHRLVRLWIVILPCLLLTAAWDSLGMALSETQAYYFGDAANHMLHHVAYQHSASVFFGNLFFLQGVAVTTFGSNGALWSLANEFWYYVLFPLGLIALWKSQRFAVRVACGLLFIMIAFWLRGSLLLRFPIWLAGGLLLGLPKLRVSGWVRCAAVAIYGATIVALALSSPHLTLIAFDFLFAIATLALLWILMSATSMAPSTRAVRAIRFLARGSFSLYLAHMPILTFIAAYIVGSSRWQPTPFHVLEAFIILVFTLVYSFVVAYFTEFRTDRLRRRFELTFPTMAGARRQPD